MLAMSMTIPTVQARAPTASYVSGGGRQILYIESIGVIRVVRQRDLLIPIYFVACGKGTFIFLFVHKVHYRDTIMCSKSRMTGRVYIVHPAYGLFGAGADQLLLFRYKI